ncbi:hypothetical protein J5N97_023430 [Dioscorea zingiberensis]|uniref:Uncharacterized protein n=1 Tax=Dioscorea zingiberensis TaxID=325984 RepID=A0A9D5H7W2_9LILI|nr:hypothetical protein J5N97_023430 [Dioscorea zingiberensis]
MWSRSLLHRMVDYPGTSLQCFDNVFLHSVTWPIEPCVIPGRRLDSTRWLKTSTHYLLRTWNSRTVVNVAENSLFICEFIVQRSVD